ncbi:MAG TPA: thiol reductant ABC exporter subunit CydC [Acidimicrobiales bacterium]|nr:thiol reductant ABC exporter subunit CydC [Acidimicrobiales bacterium]
MSARNADPGTAHARSSARATGLGPAGFVPAAGAGALTATCGIGLMSTSAWLITRASERPPVLSLCVAIGAVQAFSLGKGLFRYLQRLAVHRLSLNVLGQLRLHLWDVLVPLVPAGLGSRGQGRALSGFVSDAELVAEGFSNATTAGVDLTASIVLGTLLTTLIAPLLGAILLLGALAVTLGTVAVARLGSGLETQVGAERAQLAALVTETVRSAPELVAFGRPDIVAQHLEEARARGATLDRWRGWVAGLSRAVAIIGAGAVLAGTVGAGLSLNHSGRLGGVMLAVAVFCGLAALDQCTNLPNILSRTVAARSARERLWELEHLVPPVEEPPPSARPLPVEASAGLAQVSTLGSSGEPVLRDVSLAVSAGERLALVGPSGAGKTSALYALLHFVACSKGRAEIGTLDVSQLTRQDIATMAGWVPDETHVFSATLRDNLRLAQPKASDAECSAALRRAGLAKWAAGLAEGLATELGAGGRPMSAGERQRLGLARALLAGSPLLLLDEPTARLDPATTERLVHELLASAGRRTVIVVSHDQSVKQYVDRVVALHGGSNQ